MTFDPLIKSHFVFEDPIKISGDKFALIVEVDGNYIPTVCYNKNGEIKTYYTNNEISNDLKEYDGNMPFYVYTISEEISEEEGFTLSFE